MLSPSHPLITALIYKFLFWFRLNVDVSSDDRVYPGHCGTGTVCGNVSEKDAAHALYNALGVYLPLITTNCAVLGVALINVQKSYGIRRGRGIRPGNGGRIYSIAIVLMAGIREKIRRQRCSGIL